MLDQLVFLATIQIIFRVILLVILPCLSRNADLWRPLLTHTHIHPSDYITVLIGIHSHLHLLILLLCSSYIDPCIDIHIDTHIDTHMHTRM